MVFTSDGVGSLWVPLFFAAVLVAYMWVPLFFPISQDGGFPAGSLVFATLEVGSHGFTACVAEMCERSVALAFTACQKRIPLGSLVFCYMSCPVFCSISAASAYALRTSRQYML